MEKSNYALISALYANSSHGLYSDIYFPIIEYALVCLFSEREESHPYCSSDAIHDFIVDKFGISIPHIVISKSILKIDAQRWGNIKLNVYEKGDTFQIQSASFDTYDEKIADREKLFTEKIAVIEDKYQLFLEREGTIDDGISFIQFISDNTDDILGYFEKQDASKVDEKYATMVFFLQYLSDHEKELYQVANQLFWGSVIAGFLKSEKPLVEENEDGIKTEYFLDTSIVMGLLKLSTPQREIYSQEVCDIVKSAGGILRVNPMTIDEISFILQSVEQNGPNPLTDIASACDRYKLEAIDLAQIRLNLPSEIEKRGVNVFPLMNPAEKQKAIQLYQGNNITKLLGESRNKKPVSYSSDNYREIHDVFMDDYIKERRKKKGDNNHVYFLTANRDLIAFCRTMHPSVNHMISTGEVILNLWMHNTKPVDISGCMLTETMARCLDLHSTRVRSKIAEVSRLYNKTKNDFNLEIYKDFIKKLYCRAKHVIQVVEADPEEIVEGEYGKLIKEAVDADNLAYNKEAAKVREENVQLNENIASKNEEIEIKRKEVELLTNENRQKQVEIENLTGDRVRLSSELENKEKERKQIEEEKQKESAAKQKAERINSLYKRRDELKNLIERTNADIIPYERSLEGAFCNWQPKLFYTLGGICIACIVILWILSYSSNVLSASLNGDKDKLSIILGSIGTIFFGIGHHYDSVDSIKRRKEHSQQKWLGKKENSKYIMLQDDLSRYNDELKSIEKELNT